MDEWMDGNSIEFEREGRNGTERFEGISTYLYAHCCCGCKTRRPAMDERKTMEPPVRLAIMWRAQAWETMKEPVRLMSKRLRNLLAS